MFDFEQMEEIAETYLKMLDTVQFSREIFKHFECVICLKEFEEGEKLY